MATIDLGKIKQVWRGTYNNSTAYTVDDLVEYTDSGITSSYICVANSTGNAPSSSGTAHASWNYMAKGVADPIPSQSGNAGKFLKTNGSAVSFDTVESALNKFATFELYDNGGNFRCFPIVMGVSGSQNNMQIHWNRLRDHGNIIGSYGSYGFQVNETGTYSLDIQFVNHNPQHYRLPYLFNTTDSKAAESFTGTGGVSANNQFNCIGYHASQSGHLTFGETYYLATGKNYDFRFSCDGNMAGMGTGTSYLLANYNGHGSVTQYNVVFRARLFKVATPS